MSREAFNWSVLDRDQLYDLLYSIRPNLVGQRISVSRTSQILKKQIKTRLPVSVTCSRYKPVKTNEIWIGGIYHSDFDRKKRKRFIEIQFAFNEKDSKILLQKYAYSKICKRFADVMLHEIIHCRQFRARKFKCIPGYQSDAAWAKDRKEQEYYGDKDEMGAYAFNIACGLLDKFGNDRKKIENYLNSTPRRYKDPSTWQDFLKAFDWNYNHPRVKRMKRKVLSQLELARKGKPFRTNEHLTY